MEENCYVEPIYKNAVSTQQLQQADRATVAISGIGCQNCATRVRNSLLSLETEVISNFLREDQLGND